MNIVFVKKLLFYGFLIFMMPCMLWAGKDDEAMMQPLTTRVKRSMEVEDRGPLKKLRGLQRQKEYYDEASVVLKPGKGTKQHGGGKGGSFWNIFVCEKRAGKVFINLIDGASLGEHPSIQIFLNKASQGKHIGRIAYAKACESSSYDTIYAHIAKKNIASRKAAEAAGFKSITVSGAKQLVMKWLRP